MSVTVCVEKINTRSNTRKIVDESVAMEAPVNIFVNDQYVITLLATPQFQKELALGWLFDEGVLQSLDEVTEVLVDQERIRVMTRNPVDEKRLQASGVSRLVTTACNLSAREFFKTISDESKLVESDYELRAGEIIKMARRLDESKLFQATGGVHVAALFEEDKLTAFAEDVGRHNAVDKVVGIGIQSKANFSRSVLVSSGRQPADMILKAARMGIPIVASRAAPIRSGIIAAEKAGVTLVCFVRDQQMNVYTHPNRILSGDAGTS